MFTTLLVIVSLVAILVGFNALYVAGEFSAVGARRTRLSQMAEGGNRMAQTLLPVLEDRERLDHYIAACQVGITISSLVLGIYGQQQIAPRLETWFVSLGVSSTQGGILAAGGLAAGLVLVVLTTLQVVLGELVPKSVAVQYPERLALATALPVRWSAEFIFRPLIAVLNGSGRILLRWLGADFSSEHSHVHSPEEILILVQESHRSGQLDSDERRLLRNIFRASETTAGEIAVPRTRLVTAEINENVGAVLSRAAESAFTRVPVYEQHLDQTLGFVHLRDLFNLYRRKPEGSLQEILRLAPFVPETLSSAEVWARLNEAGSYVAFVFDEYGGTSGMLTREDMIEELFGELQDEFDQEHSLITSAGEGRFLVRGDMTISYLNNLLNVDLPHISSMTIGGLLQERLGHVPRVGEVVHEQDLRLQVESVANHSVNAVSITLPEGMELPDLDEDGG